MNSMERFDLIVIGSGAGTHVASQAALTGMKTALVDRGLAGGTCLNSGCVPSKMLIYPADVIRVMQEARAIGVYSSIDKIDFPSIMSRMHQVVNEGRANLVESIKSKTNLTYLPEQAEFIDDYVLRAGEETLTAPKFVIATGSRSLVPPIPGLEESGYLDNVSLLALESPPKSLVIIGGGYIGCEYGHFFSAMGTDVTILGRSPRLLGGEDPEIAGRLKESLSRYCWIVTGHEVVSVKRRGESKIVSTKGREDGQARQFKGEEILLAAGRRSNSDLLHPERTGIETDRHGWIRVNEYMETSKKGIWAVGDATGRYMFRHTANYESKIAAHNILRAKNERERQAAEYHAVPYAIFSHPTVAAVGMKEAEAVESGFNVLVGRASYTDIAKGKAMAEEYGFAKVILDEDTGRILGAAVIGSMAAELIQQMVYLMNTESQDLTTVVRSQVIHPTISQVLTRALTWLERSKVHRSDIKEGRQ